MTTPNMAPNERLASVARKLREIADLWEKYYFDFDFDGIIDRNAPANEWWIEDSRATIARRLREIAGRMEEGQAV